MEYNTAFLLISVRIIQMQTPKILAALANDRAAHNIAQKFESSLKAIEQGVADKKMWNSDYENFKYWVNEGCEKALDQAAEPWRDQYRAGQRPTYSANDPRFNIGYMVSPLHARGFLNRLKKYANEPAVAAYITVLEEVAPVGELMKTLKPYIVKGRKPNPNPGPEPDLTNTGVCPVCMKRQKLTFDSKMVDHGYTVPQGWGGRNGHCLGFKHQPYELSNEGCIFFKGILVRQREGNLEYIQKLEAREIPEFTRTRQMYVGPGRYKPEVEITKKGDPKYEDMVKMEIEKTKTENSHLTSDIKSTDKLIADWKLQPLKYGGPETQERWKSRLTPKP